MTKKLIDWAQCPSGASVINQDTLDKGVLLNESESEAFVYYDNHICAGSHHVSELRLAPADQQPWLVYEEGITVVPEWAEVKYKITESGDYGQASYLDEVKTLPDFYEENYEQYEIALYKIFGIKTGWTDSPEEVFSEKMR
jgi:hypothetical protein